MSLDREVVALKPCPFCGGVAGLSGGEPTWSAFVECLNAECPAAPTVNMDTRAEATEAWNTRSLLPPDPAGTFTSSGGPQNPNSEGEDVSGSNSQEDRELVERLEKAASINGLGYYLEDLLNEAASRISSLMAEVEEAYGRIESNEIAHRDYRRRWQQHDVLKRIDQVRQNIAGLRPGDAEALAELQSRLLNTEASLQALRERADGMEKALEPFAKFGPSSLYPGDGSEAEEYVVTLKGGYGNPTAFTGADLARARQALSYPQDKGEEFIRTVTLDGFTYRVKETNGRVWIYKSYPTGRYFRRSLFWTNLRTPAPAMGSTAARVLAHV